MRKLMTVLGVLGVLGAFSISNAESIIGTGTISIQQMKDTIVKLIQDDTAQSQRIVYLTQELANLEGQVEKLAGEVQELAGKITNTATTNHTRMPRPTSMSRTTRMPHSSDIGKPSQTFGFKVKHCTKYCLISHLKKGNKYCVIASGLNVRKGPGVNYRVIDVLSKGTVVSAVAREGEWIKISHPSDRGRLVGWVFSSYLRECNDGRKER